MISRLLAFIAISALGIVGSMTSTMYIQSAQADSCSSRGFCNGCIEPNNSNAFTSEGYQSSNGKCQHDDQDPCEGYQSSNGKCQH
jgi:hypothetical protein